MGRVTQSGLDEREARMLLTRLAEPGDAAVVAEVARTGAVDVVRRVVDGDPSFPPGESLRVRLDKHPAAVAATDLERVVALGGTFLAPDDPGWPGQLDQLGDRRPLGLWLLGGADLRFASLRSVAVVGARSATRYGVQVAGDLAAELARRGWTVVSGGAYGIDAAAHRGALAVDGVTVAVLAGGVDVPYPREHDHLLAVVAESGLVVSEVPPGTAPRRWRFLVRNRVIAALARGTVVVEAAYRSGALATARDAEGLGRVVMGVPGPVTSSSSAGVHGMLRRGAALVTSADEVVELVGRVGDDLAPEGRGPEAELDHLGPEQARVLDSLPLRRCCSTDRVAVGAGLPVGTVIASLAALELEGLAERTPSGWRRTARPA